MVIGVAAKALAPKLISLQVFALTQVAMDIEPGVRMAMDSDVLHGWSHTLAGAIPVALASAVAWKILERRRIWRWTFDPITPAMLWSTCFVGTWSHVGSCQASCRKSLSIQATFWSACASLV